MYCEHLRTLWLHLLGVRSGKLRCHTLVLDFVECKFLLAQQAFSQRVVIYSMNEAVGDHTVASFTKSALICLLFYGLSEGLERLVFRLFQVMKDVGCMRCVAVPFEVLVETLKNIGELLLRRRKCECVVLLHEFRASNM